MTCVRINSLKEDVIQIPAPSLSMYHEIILPQIFISMFSWTQIHTLSIINLQQQKLISWYNDRL